METQTFTLKQERPVFAATEERFGPISAKSRHCEARLVLANAEQTKALLARAISIHNRIFLPN